MKHLPSALCDGRMGVWEDAPDREVAPGTMVQMPVLLFLLSPSSPLTGPVQLSPSCFQLQTSGLPQNGHFPWATLDAGGAASKNEGNLFACPVGLGAIPSCTQCQLNPDAALRQPLNLAFTPRPLSSRLLFSYSPVLHFILLSAAWTNV